MTMWSPEHLDEATPIYQSIADAVARDVASGRLPPGTRLPTHRALARELGVNVMTVSRAYAEAARRGLVEGEVGRGTFVRRPRERQEALRPQRAAGIDFHFNLPAGDPELLDASAIFEDLARGDHRSLIHAGYSAAGQDDHRAAGGEWIGRSGLEAPAERVLVCGGVQHAMTVTFASLTRPGDTLLCGALTYPGMKALASVLGLRLEGLEMDAEGMLPDAFDAACRRGGARVLYCMPTIHNPTGGVMPEPRRREIVAVARRHDVTVVEDDTYGFLCAEPPPALAALAPERTYYLVGTSKSLSAGLRIGYLLIPERAERPVALLERLESHVAALTWMAAPLMAEIATRFIRSGQADAMVAWKRREAAARRALFERLLPAARVDSHPASSHLWLPLPAPWRGPELVAAARRRGVAISTAEAFVVGRAPAPHAVRLCLGTPRRRDEVETGLGILAEILAGSPETVGAIV